MQEGLQGLIYALDVFIVISVILGLLLGLRWKYGHDLAPSKEWPHGKMIAEFWTTAGPRYRQVMGILPNGFEVKSPAGHKNPRYFFNKAAVGHTKYPLQPLLPFSFVQVDAMVVSWYQDNPEPIPATRAALVVDGKVVTSELMDLARDTETLSTAQAVNEEMAKTQDQLVKAIAGRLDKRIVYIGLIVAVVGAVMAAIFAYKAFDAIKIITGPG